MRELELAAGNHQRQIIQQLRLRMSKAGVKSPRIINETTSATKILAAALPCGGATNRTFSGRIAITIGSPPRNCFGSRNNQDYL
jgi:hypothetical protein